LRSQYSAAHNTNRVRTVRICFLSFAHRDNRRHLSSGLILKRSEPGGGPSDNVRYQVHG
jgi:hypothetical protein